MNEAQTARWQTRSSDPGRIPGPRFLGFQRPSERSCERGCERSFDRSGIQGSEPDAQERSCQIARHAIEKTIALKVDCNVLLRLTEVHSREGSNRVRARRSGLFERLEIVGSAEGFGGQAHRIALSPLFFAALCRLPTPVHVIKGCI